MNNYSIKTEIFKDIEGYEGLYEISNAGTVKSLDRMTTRSDGRKRRFLGQVLSARKAGAGYIHPSTIGKIVKRKLWKNI